MGLSFAQPVWLLLALIAIPLGVIGLRWMRTMSAARAWSAVIARSLLIALVAAMLAGTAAVRRTERLAVIAVVDVSGSVRHFADLGREPDGRPRQATSAIRDWLQHAIHESLRSGARPNEDLFGAVVFDGAAVAVLAPRPISTLGADARGVQDIPLDLRLSEGTNIEDALRLAAAMIPPGASARLLLASDGAATTGDAVRAAQELSGGTGGGDASIVRRTPIDVLPLAYGAQPEVAVEFVDSPPQAASESTVAVRIGLRAAAPARGTLFLLREGELVDINGAEPGAGRRVEIGAGTHVEVAEVRLDEKAIHRFAAVFEPDSGADTIAANNRGESVTVTPGRGAVLVLDGVSKGDPRGSGAALPSALRSAGLEVHVAPPGGLPPDLLSLHAYDAVILQNVAAEEIPRSAQALLVDYVSALGGGLVMVGGPDSFGPGGWNGTPIEDILPVRLDLPEQLVIPSAAIVLVLDSSGSMGQRVLGGSRTQQDIANEAAALAIETLDRKDLVGVVTFNNVSQTLVPIGPNEDAQATADRVRAISPGGGTNLNPALAEAGRMLRSVEANVKHVIVLSDGRSRGSSEEALNIATDLASDGVTISTIAVGDEADVQTLSAIAARGRGAHHRVLDPYSLPRVFIREIRVVRKPQIRETPFTPVILPSGSPLTAGVGGSWPRLFGLVLTQRRPEPTITYAAEAPSGEPLLAHWNVGLGEVAAFTSDAHRWAAPWLDWSGYGQLWTQIVRGVARPPGRTAGALFTEVVDGRLHIRLEAADESGAPLDLLTVPGLLYEPDSSRPRDIRLTQTGPGVYEAEVDAERSGNYVVALTPRQGQRALPPLISGASRASGAEYRRLRSDVSALRRLAEQTGGRVFDLNRPQDATLFDRSGLQPMLASTPLWRVLLVWALVVFLFDVGTRRVAWDRLLTRELAAEIRRAALDTAREQGDRAAATAARLRGSRGRGRGAAGRAPAAETAEASPGVPLARPARRADPGAGAGAGGRGPKAPAQVSTAEAEARRREAVRTALRATRSAPGSAGEAKPVIQPPKAEKDGEISTSGLLAAKERVRRRYGGENEGQNG